MYLHTIPGHTGFHEELDAIEHCLVNEDLKAMPLLLNEDLKARALLLNEELKAV